MDFSGHNSVYNNIRVTDYLKRALGTVKQGTRGSLPQDRRRDGECWGRSRGLGYPMIGKQEVPSGKPSVSGLAQTEALTANNRKHGSSMQEGSNLTDENSGERAALGCLEGL